MESNIKTKRTFYLYVDLDRPSIKRLLDRMEIDLNDIRKFIGTEPNENKYLLINDKNILKEVDSRSENIKNQNVVPILKMSEMENDLSDILIRKNSVYTMTKDKNFHQAVEQMKELGLKYDIEEPRDFKTKSQQTFLVFNNHVYPFGD